MDKEVICVGGGFGGEVCGAVVCFCVCRLAWLIGRCGSFIHPTNIPYNLLVLI